MLPWCGTSGVQYLSSRPSCEILEPGLQRRSDIILYLSLISAHPQHLPRHLLQAVQTGICMGLFHLFRQKISVISLIHIVIDRLVYDHRENIADRKRCIQQSTQLFAPGKKVNLCSGHGARLKWVQEERFRLYSVNFRMSGHKDPEPLFLREMPVLLCRPSYIIVFRRLNHQYRYIPAGQLTDDIFAGCRFPRSCTAGYKGMADESIGVDLIVICLHNACIHHFSQCDRIPCQFRRIIGKAHCCLYKSESRHVTAGEGRCKGELFRIERSA